MKIHLVFAPPHKIPRLGELAEGRVPPLGIMHLASYVRKMIPDAEVRITDGLLKQFDGTLEEIGAFRPDILGLSFYTPAALGAYDMAARVKQKYPQTFVVAGGPHPNALPEEALLRAPIDVVVRGEGEATFHELVSLWVQGEQGSPGRLRKVQGVVFRDNGGIVHTEPRPPRRDLEALPPPARDLIDMYRYKGWYLNKERHEAAVFMQRGCPYHCTFCSIQVWKMAKPYVTFRPASHVVDELEEIVAKYGIREIYDVSDEFNASEAQAIAICEEIKRRKLNIRWKASVRVHPLSERLVSLMAETGCWYVLVGVESGNQETIDGIQKNITHAQVERAGRLFHEHGIKVMGLFMLYNVWEEEGKLCFEDTAKVKNTLQYIGRLARDGVIDYFGWSITIPYPGSKLYDIATRHGLIKPEYQGRWDRWLVGDHWIMQLPGVDRKEQMYMKVLGSVLRARLILRERDFHLKDFPWMVKKSFKLMRDGLAAVT